MDCTLINLMPCPSRPPESVVLVYRPRGLVLVATTVNKAISRYDANSIQGLIDEMAEGYTPPADSD